MVGFAISSTSLLVLAKQTTDILLRVARQAFPIIALPGGMVEGDSPLHPR
jgi:hypothetical protein